MRGSIVAAAVPIFGRAKALVVAVQYEMSVRPAETQEPFQLIFGNHYGDRGGTGVGEAKR